MGVNPKQIKIAIVASLFNEYITRRLLDACLEELRKQGITDKNVVVQWVPGSFEIPVAALKLAVQKNIHGVICLGNVIRGETLHFELVAQEAARGIMQVSLATGKPVIFGVLATDTVKQAESRSEARGDNKGREAAQTVLKMVEILGKI